MIRVAQSNRRNDDGYWDWSVWLEGLPDELDGVKSVSYQLHSSFPDPLRKVTNRKTNFRLDSSGWGEFDLYATVTGRDNRARVLKHWLTLRDQGGADETDENEPSRTAVVYISSGVADADYALMLCDALSDRGVETLNTDLTPLGLSFADSIHHMLARADAAVVVVSDTSTTWLSREIALIQQRNLPLIPVVIARGSSESAPLAAVETHPMLSEKAARVIKGLAEISDVADEISSFARRRDDESAPVVNELDVQDDDYFAAIAGSHYFNGHLRFELLPGQDLGAARIVRDNPAALQIFGLERPPSVLNDVFRKACDRDERWIVELQEAIDSASEGKMPRQVQAVFRAPRGGKIYQPVLNRMKAYDDGRCRFDVIFVQSPGRFAPLRNRDERADPPVELDAIATSMRLGYRVQWDAIRFHLAKEIMTPEDIEILDDVLSSIEAEASSRGLMDQSILLNAFEEPDRSDVADLIKRWVVFRNADKSGILDKAMATADVEATRKCLLGMAEINATFMRIVSRRFARFFQ